MGMLQTGNMARQPHTGSGRATFARRASALTWLVRSMMILCAAGCPKPMVQESIVKVSIGAPSVIDTLAGPVTYPVTYANAAEISLYPDDVTLATSGSVTGRVSAYSTVLSRVSFEMISLPHIAAAIDKISMELTEKCEREE